MTVLWEIDCALETATFPRVPAELAFLSSTGSLFSSLPSAYPFEAFGTSLMDCLNDFTTAFLGIYIYIYWFINNNR